MHNVFFYVHSLKNENRERRWILNPGYSKTFRRVPVFVSAFG